MSIKNNKITDIYLRNNYELYLDNNKGTTKNYFLESNKNLLFSRYRNGHYRTFYKILNSKLILVENRNDDGVFRYFKTDI